MSEEDFDRKGEKYFIQKKRMTHVCMTCYDV